MTSEEGASSGSSLRDLFVTNNLVRLFRRGEAMDAILKVISESEAQITQPQADGSSLLHSFSMLGCYDIVKLLWDKGARPSILKKDNSTVLHSTVRTQDDSEDEERSKILDLFLSSEEDQGNSMPIDYKCSKGWTALKLAAHTNLEHCVEVLLERGADPDTPDDESYTPLHNAIGNPDIVKLLATKSNNIDARNQEGETALYVACERGLVDSALTLLEYKASPNILNKEGITPLFLASRAGHLELVKALVRKGANVTTLGAAQNIGALHWAAHKENAEVAIFLIENGADVTQTDKEGRTPLSMASPELATQMIAAAQRVNPSITLPTLNAPSMSADEKAVAACCGGNMQALQVLLQAGVSVNHAGGSTGSTLLHMAAYCGQIHIIIFLIQQGADWKAVDTEGDSVLHFACMKEMKSGVHDKTLDLLLNPPVVALKNKQNARGDTPIMVATRCKFMPRVRLLLQHKADVTIANYKNELPLHRACSSTESIEALLYFSEVTPDLDTQDSDGWSPLMYAAKASATAIVKYLLQKGANPNIRQTSGFTALYLAAQEENVAVCRLLLEAKADPHLAGGTQNLTPLHIAAHRNCRAVCMLLVEHGADINLPDTDGDTPLSLAESTELKQSMLVTYIQRRSQSESTADNEIAGPIKPSTTDQNDSQISNETDQSVASDEDDGKVGGECVLPRQGTFSKEDEREGSEGDTVPQARYQEVLQELHSQNETLTELKSELSSSQQDKEILLSRNKSLSEDLRRLEMLMVAHHIEKGLVVSEPDHSAGERRSGDKHAWWLVCKSQYEITGNVLNKGKWTGKFFDVYLGTYRQLPVIVKIVRDVEAWGPEVYRTFYQEVDVISQLQCPWVLQFLGCRIDMDSKQCVVLTELMRSCLHSALHVKRIDLEWKNRVRIIQDVCRGMLFLHSHDTLHRNLVPRNILIGEHLNAKISDFGLWETQNALSDVLQSQSEAPQVYMSPEAMEKLEFTQAADVYSFGIIMCEVATGSKPFSDLEDKPLLLAMKVLMGQRPTFTGGVSMDYQKIAEACWQCEPESRPSFETVKRNLDLL